MIVALSGGIGGAKLALGLSRIVLPASRLAIIANTGDDFEHLGLSVSPDIDTLMYTLSGLDNPDLGWGRRDETWSFIETLASLGGETWFRLGDRDLAVHIERTRRLRAGERLSAITGDFCRRLAVGPRVLPMSDDPLRTRVRTDQGWIDFQEYFVHRRCEPAVRDLAFDGAERAGASDAILSALAGAEAVIICPSNPFISIDPILAVPGIAAAIGATKAPVVAVSPIIGGRSVKGPTAKMMAELGIGPSARAVAERYGKLLDGFVADEADRDTLAGLDMALCFAPTLMTTAAEKETLARVVLDFAAGLR